MNADKDVAVKGMHPHHERYDKKPCPAGEDILFTDEVLSGLFI